MAVFVLYLSWQAVTVYHGQFSSMGDDYYLRGMTDEALELYRSARRIIPWSAASNLGISQTLRALGRSREALPVLRQALFFAPRHQPLLLELGLCHAGLGDWSEAAIAFRRAASVSSREAALALKMAEIGRAHV